MKKITGLLAISGFIALPAYAQVTDQQATIMKQLISTYTDKAKSSATKAKEVFVPFSVENGRQIYLMMRNWEGDEQTACSTCHTDNPKNQGTHVVSKKPIDPLAPAVNKARFTDVGKVEKNFSKHCRELYSRDCTDSEKGNFLTYLLSVK